MGATSSHHSPEHLDKNRNGTSFRRSYSLRQTKSKANKSSPNKRIDQIRRSFRDSFRRKKNKDTDTTLSEPSKPHLWQNDEADVRSGTCSFHVKYLGSVEVFEPRGMRICEEALKVLKNSRHRPVKSLLHVSGDGLRVIEDDTKGLIIDQTIEKVSFCAPDRNHDRGFSYICRDGTSRRWMCYGFIASKDSGERLSHAVGCAFAICLERKQRRDKECSVTMNFDMLSSTFTRMGSFRQKTLTEKLQDTTNMNNASVTTPSNTISHPTFPANAVININNSADYNRKENIPIRMTPKVHTTAIDRPHANMSMLQRQGVFRGLSHSNSQTSPFKRQLSLRISDLPSNVERTRSRSLNQYALELTTSTSQFSHLKTPVSPIPEVSPTHSNDLNLSTTNTARSTQLAARDLFNSKLDDFSPIKLKTINSSSTTFVQKSCSEANNPLDLFLCQPSQQQPSPQQQKQSHVSSDLLHLMDATNSNDNNTSRDRISNSSSLSQPESAVSSVEIPLTPPTTPPLPNNVQLPKPEQWLGKVAQLAMNVSDCSSTSSSPPAITRIPALGMHSRAYSPSLAETVLSRAAAANSNEKLDPFNIDWVALTIDIGKTTPVTGAAPSKNTNPFLTDSPEAGTSSAANNIKTSFEMQI